MRLKCATIRTKMSFGQICRNTQNFLYLKFQTNIATRPFFFYLNFVYYYTDFRMEFLHNFKKPLPWLRLNDMLSVWFIFIVYISSTDADAHEIV